MRTKQAQRRDLDVHLGTERRLIGRFYLGSGKRSAFRYDERWLRGPRLFKVSPDRQPVSGVQHPQGVFFRALEDTAPDAWGGSGPFAARMPNRASRIASSRLWRLSISHLG
ncbi:hypothetical protein [Alloalcanivorax xenomutans]|uniref:hypothetical protein n=1 Tax=Alloalcanivorax xenomutans TaxID=1094342 RepID=UPI0009B64BA9|nr:hypothetical protein [Alloalcanivorax xenomutans]